MKAFENTLQIEDAEEIKTPSDSKVRNILLPLGVVIVLILNNLEIVGKATRYPAFWWIASTLGIVVTSGIIWKFRKFAMSLIPWFFIGIAIALGFKIVSFLF